MWELPSWSTAFPFSCAHCFGPPVLVLCEGTESYYRLLNLKNLMEKNPKQTKEVNWQYGGYFCHISEVTFVVFINIQNLCASKTDFFLLPPGWLPLLASEDWRRISAKAAAAATPAAVLSTQRNWNGQKATRDCHDPRRTRLKRFIFIFGFIYDHARHPNERKRGSVTRCGLVSLTSTPFTDLTSF